MSTADTILRGVALVLSVVLVLLLAALALVSVFDSEELGEVAQGEVSPLDDDEVATQDPASATALSRSDRVQVGPDQAPLALSCRSIIGNGGEFVVLAENLGPASSDLLVAVDLIDADERRVEAVAEAVTLLADESRPLPLEIDEPIDQIDRCVITAIQQNRQVILTGQ